MSKPIEPTRWTETEMIVLAAKGLGRVERDGHRGATLVTADEIVAMAGVLVALGLIPVLPGMDVPAKLFVTQEKDA